MDIPHGREGGTNGDNRRSEVPHLWEITEDAEREPLSALQGVLSMTQILPDPIANLDADGRLVKLHCGTPGERCNLDDAEDKRTVTWETASILLGGLTFGQARAIAERSHQPFCQFCFGGEGPDNRCFAASEALRKHREGGE